MIHDGFTRLERYELKYHVPLDRLAELETFLADWCEPDPASVRTPGGFYWVTSLYLDNFRYTLLRMGEAKPERRFNMRIRAYGEDPSGSRSWHFEVKDKSCDLVTKLRGVLKGRHPRDLWDDTSAVLAEAGDEDRRNLERFLHLSLSYNTWPVFLTQYRRKAWFGVHDEYARVTLDIGMRWREELDFDFSVEPREMRPSDLPERFDPGCNAVLELKCPRESVPGWMIELIRRFNLVRSGFSKFESAGRACLVPPRGDRRAPA